MKYLMLFVFPLVYLCTSKNAVAQEKERYQPGKIIPPAPTAAALGTYGEFPVGYYSGTADISIPIYEIKTDKIQLPLKLQYTSTGVKVGENASWVGLGWSLFAGGTITRSVRGLNDWEGEGYYNALPLPPDNYTTADYPYFNQIYQGYRDGEPDIFSYNFAGMSGRFAIGKKNDGSLVYMDDRNNLKVEIVLNKGWRITDGNGIKYCFGTQEAASDYYYSSQSQEISNTAPLSAFNSSGKPLVATAWHLDSIIAPGVDTILFSYKLGGAVLSLINKSEKAYNLLESRYGPAPSNNFTYSANRQVTGEMNLKSISFRQGSIEFNTTLREDLEFTDNNKPVKLSGIVVKNKDNRIIKNYQLYHNYWGAGTEGRLKLDSIVDIGAGGTDRIPYKFEYYSGDLPPKYSKGIDGFGYYNNTNNQFLVPAMVVSPSVGDPISLAGGNREANANDADLKAGVLSSIAYPTAGKTVFDYEQNSYANLHGDEQYIIRHQSEIAQAGSGFSSDRGWVNFTIPITDTPVVRITFGHTKVDPNGPDLMNENLQAVYGYIYKGTNVIASYSNWDEYHPYYEMVLYPGSYSINARLIQGYWTRIGVSYDLRTRVKEKKGGGLRIKSIINYDADKKASVRKFLYTENIVNETATSGIRILTPVYSYKIDVSSQGTGVGDAYDATYVVRESNSMVQGTGSAVIGYSKVTELFGENGENGKTEYYYRNREDMATAPYLPPLHDNLNGKLWGKRAYNVAGNLLSKTTYEYELNEQVWLRGVKLYAFDPIPVTGLPGMLFKFYRHMSEWFVPSKEETITYDNSGNGVTTTKRFVYGNPTHRELTRMETDKSDGTTQISKYIYPDDYAAAGSGSFAGEMKSRHMIAPVIEEQTLIAGGTGKKLAGGKYTTYKALSNGSYAPAAIYMLNAAAPLADTAVSTITGNNPPVLHPAYTAEAYFDNYDRVGNLKDFHKPNNAPVAYLWNYGDGYPVAQISNATASDVSYTSFEADASGNWNISSAARNTTGGLTGERSYNLSNGVITSASFTAGRSYLLSYWSQSGACGIQGATIIKTTTGKTVKGYTYYQHQVTIGAGGIVTLYGNNVIDELRLFPADAQINTYTYSPLIGISSQCDHNNQLMFYEYDNKNRLKLIRDQDGKIIKMICYNYYGQPENCDVQ